ncbi:MAG: hypothetical protein EBX36_00940 [Planctomycetia bacterium]|nr:hypothetical protein [Planctomycetia bacterium]
MFSRWILAVCFALSVPGVSAAGPPDTAAVNHTYEARIRLNGKVSTTQVQASDAGHAKKSDGGFDSKVLPAPRRAARRATVSSTAVRDSHPFEADTPRRPEMAVVKTSAQRVEKEAGRAGPVVAPVPSGESTGRLTA